MIVADASLAIKWYLDEPLADEADAWLTKHQRTVAVPEVFLVEVTGALVRRANMDKSLRALSEQSIARFVALFDESMIVIDSGGAARTARAARLALDLGHPLKDCIYLALAIDLGCELVTCDARFAEKAKAAWPQIRLLGE